MPYIGNQSTNSYSSMVKQDLTGASGASVTLSHPVANANEVELYINNVRQEPTTSYTTSGTTLSFVGYTVAASDDIYVIFSGKALQTVVPPDGSVSTAKIASSAVTNAKIADNASISGSKLGTGAIIQVHTELTTAVLSNVTLAGQSSELTASSGTLWHTCASFTPKFSNSKLLFQTSVITAHESSNVASGHFAIVTDGSTLFARAASLVSYTSWNSGNNAAFIAFNHSFDSWGTSAKQLQIKFGCQHASSTAASQYVNTVSSDGYVHSTSKSIGITIMEIGA